MYRTENGLAYIEEYTVDGELIKFQVELADNLQYLDVSYCEAGYVMVNQDCGEQIQSPYTNMPDMMPVYEKSLYYRGELIATSKGMNLDYMYELEDGSSLWVIQTGDSLKTESESVYEEYENIYTLANYAILRDGKILYEIDNAFLMSRFNDTLFLLKGNYLYGVGTDGTPYIRSLHSLLNND